MIEEPLILDDTEARALLEAGDLVAKQIADGDRETERLADCAWRDICAAPLAVRLFETPLRQSHLALVERGLLQEVGETRRGWAFEVTPRGETRRRGERNTEQ